MTTDALKALIKNILVQQVQSGMLAETMDDTYTSVLDSIGRLGLLVALENELGCELMGVAFGPDVFSSVDCLASFVLSQMNSKLEGVGG